MATASIQEIPGIQPQAGFAQEYVTPEHTVAWRHRAEPITILYHSIHGNALRVGGDVLRVVEAFRTPQTVSQVAQALNMPPQSVQTVVERLSSRSMIIPTNMLSAEEKLDPGLFDYPLRLFRLYVTKTCNMACTYCFQPEHDGPRMSLETLTGAIKGFAHWLELNSHRPYEIIKVNFFGGEPLVCKDLVRAGVPVIREVMKPFDDGRYKITMNTNATLITPEIAEWLVANRITVYTSLDGLLETNDQQRIFRDGRGSFNAAVKGLTTLIKAADEAYIEDCITILCTVSSRNLPQIESLAEYLGDVGLRNLAFNAAFSCAAHVPPGVRDASHWTSMTPDETRLFVKRVIALQKRLLANNFHVGGMWGFVPQRLKRGGAVFCQAVGNEIGVSHERLLYPCPTTLDNPAACIGRLVGDRFEFNTIAERWSGRTNNKMEKCTTCSVRGVCRGGCPASALLNGHDIYQPHQCDYWFAIVDAYLENYAAASDVSAGAMPFVPPVAPSPHVPQASSGGGFIPLSLLARQ